MQPHLYMLINTFPSMLKHSPLQSLQVFRDFADSRATFPLISFQIVTLLLNTQHITAICLSLPFKSNQVTFSAPGPLAPCEGRITIPHHLIFDPSCAFSPFWRTLESTLYCSPTTKLIASPYAAPTLSQNWVKFLFLCSHIFLTAPPKSGQCLALGATASPQNHSVRPYQGNSRWYLKLLNL